MKHKRNCCGINPYSPASCLVFGCRGVAIAEVHRSDLKKAWQLFGPATPASRTPDHPLLICQKHLSEDRRAQEVKWQMLLFAV
jgi:hypothetical protein